MASRSAGNEMLFTLPFSPDTTPWRRTANTELRKPPSANLSSLSCVLSAYAIV
jgi:hypothetical protein